MRAPHASLLKAARQVGRGSLGLWALSALACVVLVACGPNPKHLDDRLATQLLTKALAEKQVTVRIRAQTPSSKDRAARIDGDLPVTEDPEDHVVAVNQDAESALLARGDVVKRFRLTFWPGNGSDLSPKGYVTFQTAYVITPAGTRRKTQWHALDNDYYRIDVGTGYTVSNVRDIRFFAANGAYYAELYYDATPILNDEGRDLASKSGLGRARYNVATLLLMGDGWGVSQDGAEQ